MSGARAVRHEGKVQFIVRRDDFIKGSPENPLPEVFAELSGAIRGHVRPTIDLFLPGFSTTGPAEQAAAEAVLLDAVQAYFDFMLVTRCGFPAITLEGTPGDWTALADRADDFAEFGLDRWVESLRPILRQFVRASQGDVDRPFWESLYKLHGESGGPMVTGWTTAFFPDLKGRQAGRATEPSAWLSEGSERLLEAILEVPEVRPVRSRYGRGGAPIDRPVGGLRHGPRTTDLPGGLSKAPFRREYLDRAFDMEFLGGFVGVPQDEETLALRPEIGWAVREAHAAP